MTFWFGHTHNRVKVADVAQIMPGGEGVIDVLLIAAVLLLPACGTPNKVADRSAYWHAEASRFFTKPRTLIDLHAWLRSQNVIYVFSEGDVSDHQFRVVLEKVYLHSVRCDWMDVSLRVEVSAVGELGAFEIEESGPCLWKLSLRMIARCSCRPR